MTSKGHSNWPLTHVVLASCYSLPGLLVFIMAVAQDMIAANMTAPHRIELIEEMGDPILPPIVHRTKPQPAVRTALRSSFLPPQRSKAKVDSKVFLTGSAPRLVSRETCWYSLVVRPFWSWRPPPPRSCGGDRSSPKHPMLSAYLRPRRLNSMRIMESGATYPALTHPNVRVTPRSHYLFLRLRLKKIAMLYGHRIHFRTGLHGAGCGI